MAIAAAELSQLGDCCSLALFAANSGSLLPLPLRRSTLLRSRLRVVVVVGGRKKSSDDREEPRCCGRGGRKHESAPPRCAELKIVSADLCLPAARRRHAEQGAGRRLRGFVSRRFGFLLFVFPEPPQAPGELRAPLGRWPGTKWMRRGGLSRPCG